MGHGVNRVKMELREEKMELREEMMVGVFRVEIKVV
jgi:hypothetical protein